MGDVCSWRESFAAGSLDDRTQSVSPVRTPVLLTARRDVRPLDHHLSADCGPVVEGPSWLYTTTMTTTTTIMMKIQINRFHEVR